MLILKFAIRKATTGIDSLYFYGKFNVEAGWAERVIRKGGSDFKQKAEAADLPGYDFRCFGSLPRGCFFLCNRGKCDIL